MKLKGSREAQVLEANVDHVFRKKSTIYFDKSGIQKKICNFIVKVNKNSDPTKFTVFNEEFDFSQYGMEDKRDKEHQFEFNFKQIMVSPEFKDAYIIAKIQIVAYDPADIDQAKWIEEANSTVKRISRASILTAGLTS